jgi:hypothetical protein
MGEEGNEKLLQLPAIADIRHCNLQEGSQDKVKLAIEALKQECHLESIFYILSIIPSSPCHPFTSVRKYCIARCYLCVKVRLVRREGELMGS